MHGGSGRTNDQADRQRANQTRLTNKQPENRMLAIITAIKIMGQAKPQAKSCMNKGWHWSNSSLGGQGPWFCNCMCDNLRNNIWKRIKNVGNFGNKLGTLPRTCLRTNRVLGVNEKVID
jgi:hypothetical protein